MSRAFETQSNKNELHVGETRVTTWGTMTLEGFDDEQRAHMMIEYNGQQIPAWPRYDGEICLAVDGGLLYIANISEMKIDPDSVANSFVDIQLYAEPRFEAREYLDVNVDDITSATSDELRQLAERMFAEV